MRTRSSSTPHSHFKGTSIMSVLQGEIPRKILSTMYFKHCLITLKILSEITQVFGWKPLSNSTCHLEGQG